MKERDSMRDAKNVPSVRITEVTESKCYILYDPRVTAVARYCCFANFSWIVAIKVLI